MKKNTLFSIAELHFISVVIPSLNGNYAKLLVINKSEFNTLKKIAKSNINQPIEIFALYTESDLSHQIYHDEMGCLTKEQFDTILKEIYNQKLQKGRNNKILKNVA
jgi:hypothetical protein